jgi:DNA invertase Pin-like site-specific DNA recombinase
MKRISDRIRRGRSTPPDCKKVIDLREARPRDYILPFRKVLIRAQRDGILKILVVLYCRVSGPKQKRDGNLEHQLPYLRQRVHDMAALYGITVEIVDEIDEDDSGWKLWRSGRPKLVKAAKAAKRAGAIIVATHTSRYLRNRHHARGKLPTFHDFERLQSLVGGVQLSTVRYPDYQEDRSGDSKRGRRAKDRSPGYKKRRKESLEPIVHQLAVNGMTKRGVARQLDLSDRTIRRWWPKTK